MPYAEHYFLKSSDLSVLIELFSQFTFKVIINII